MEGIDFVVLCLFLFSGRSFFSVSLAYILLIVDECRIHSLETNMILHTWFCDLCTMLNELFYFNHEKELIINKWDSEVCANCRRVVVLRYGENDTSEEV